MVIKIRITSDEVGRAHLYSELKRQGKRFLVPTYRMFVSGLDREYHFAVTRDTPQAPGRETPPNKKDLPYHGSIREDGFLGFRIQLFEKGLSSIHLKGTGFLERSYIQIHRGPGKSGGCFLIAGGPRGHARFERIMRQLLAQHPSPVFSINVEARTGT